MSYTVGQIRRWDASALVGAGDELRHRGSVAETVRRGLADGAAALDDGWDGLAADAVLEAVEEESRHVGRLADALEDLAAELHTAHSALGPAVQTVRDRLADAASAGLIVTDVSVESPGRGGGRAAAADHATVDHATVDLHAEAIGAAVDTVRSLDEHYGRRIDEIAARLHAAIPPEVDRSPIPGPDDPWPGRGVDAMTGAASGGYPAAADELDPETRGRHIRNPAPDDYGRAASRGLRVLGRVASPLGGGLTVYDGMKSHAEGKTSAGEAFAETAGALGGGTLGGMAAGAAAGSFFGPVGTFIGAGIGAAVGSYLGQRTGEAAYEELFDRRVDG